MSDSLPDAIRDPAHTVRGREGEGTDGVAGNARLTASTAAVLFVLLAIEGYSIAVGVGAHLTLHVFVGLLLIPPVLVKMGSTLYRFVRYYAGAPEYRRKGPPPLLLRLLGPLLVILTIVLFASGVALLFVSADSRNTLDQIHRLSFIAWLVVAAVHVLSHLLETARLAPRDFYWRTRRQVRSASARQWLVVGSLVLGLILAMTFVGRTGGYFSLATYHLAP